MRSAISLLLLAAALCACGNYSNDDLVFINAIPTSDQLKVSVPQAQGQPLCALGSDDFATNARTNGTNLNQAIEKVLGLVDTIRSVPATTRSGDQRTWGPWKDDKHAGVDYVVNIVRTRGATPAQDQFDYAFAGRLDGGPWLTVISGTFHGTKARQGTGTLMLDFRNSYALGTNNPGDPDGQLQVSYTLSGDPDTIELQLIGAAGFGLQTYHYVWAGYADGRALFDFRFTDPASGNTYTVDARFTAQGDGTASITGETPAGNTAHIDTCFDAQACVTWFSDVNGITPVCGYHAFCHVGSQASCPAGVP
jgi:hypothetical protein